MVNLISNPSFLHKFQRWYWNFKFSSHIIAVSTNSTQPWRFLKVLGSKHSLTNWKWIIKNLKGVWAIVQQVKWLPCMHLTWVLFLASLMISHVPQGVIIECAVRSKPWASLIVTQKLKKNMFYFRNQYHESDKNKNTCGFDFMILKYY